MEKDNLYCFEQLCENCSNLVILELIELRAWKEHRLKDADPKIEHLVQTLGERVEILEAWKAKARPLLEDFRLLVINHEDKDYYKRRIDILTELLGGDDDTTKTS